jgi:hypothetical protein
VGPRVPFLFHQINFLLGKIWEWARLVSGSAALSLSLSRSFPHRLLPPARQQRGGAAPQGAADMGPGRHGGGQGRRGGTPVTHRLRRQCVAERGRAVRQGNVMAELGCNGIGR